MVFNSIYSVIGSRGTGKTPLIMGGDDERGLAKVYLEKGMSVLIIDTLDHPKYRSCKSLLPKNYSILSHKPGVYRTLATVDNMPALLWKLNKVWNTLIVFEDAYKYVGTTLNRSIRRVIGDSKQQNNCLVFMFSCWGWTPLDLCRQTNYYIIFKTSDSPDCRRTVLAGCADKCITAYNNAMAEKVRYSVVDSGI